MDGFVFAVALGQIVPVRPRSDDPQNSVHEQPVISARPARVRRFASQQRADTPPLCGCQFVALYRHAIPRSSNQESYESRRLPAPEPLMSIGPRSKIGAASPCATIPKPIPLGRSRRRGNSHLLVQGMTLKLSPATYT
jgi:hypothetical protein